MEGLARGASAIQTLPTRSSIRFQGGFEEAGAACWSCSSSFFGVGPPGISWIRRKHSTENRSRFSYDPGDADAVLLSRQLIADEQWTKKVKEGAKRISGGASPPTIAGARLYAVVEFSVPITRW